MTNTLAYCDTDKFSATYNFYSTVQIILSSFAAVKSLIVHARKKMVLIIPKRDQKHSKDTFYGAMTF